MEHVLFQAWVLGLRTCKLAGGSANTQPVGGGYENGALTLEVNRHFLNSRLLPLLTFGETFCIDTETNCEHQRSSSLAFGFLHALLFLLV